MPKIAVIMPCLNSIKYIRDALDSVVRQSLRDMEIIAVDAGSTDGTWDLLREYAGNDSRVRVLRSDRKSMGYQYNLGMDAAGGEYIGFAETDDFMQPDMYEKLYSIAAAAGDIDYVKSDFDMFADIPGERLFARYELLPARELYGEVISASEYAFLLQSDCVVWNGIYKTEFVRQNGIRFNETPGAAFQDAGFTQQALMRADKAIYTEDAFYKYRRDNESSSIYTKKAYRFIIDEFDFVMERITKPSLFLPLICRRFFGLFNDRMRKYLYWCDSEENLPDDTGRFQESFRAGFAALDIPQLSRSLLWPPQNLLLFMEDFERYCDYTRRLVRNDASSCKAFAAYVKEKRDVVLIGDLGKMGAAYCYLRYNGADNIRLWDGDASPDALYVIDHPRREDIRRDLKNAGIGIENICYSNPILKPFDVFEPYLQIGN